MPSLSNVANLFLVAVLNGADAINYGQPDGDDHPMVGLMIAQTIDGTPLWRCSGALISPTIYLTAGHCVAFPAERAEIWFDADVEAGIPGNGYPFTGDAGGVTVAHPLYNGNAFVLHDVGIVVLDQPVDMAEYASLPYLGQTQDLVDTMPKGQIKFKTVGYGLQRISPVVVEAERVRMRADPKLISIEHRGLMGEDVSLLLTNNAATGGTCFGDSGGPNFYGDTLTVAGVTSFGLNGNCAGLGGVYRVDMEDDLDFLCNYVDCD